jgi:hypothetical protein
MAANLSRTGMPAGVLTAVWIGIAGCGTESAGLSDPVAEPETPVAAAAPKAVLPTARIAAPEAPAKSTLDFSDEIADLRNRFLPTLEPRARESVGGALEDLAARASADDRGGAAAALTLAGKALHQGDAGPADLDALRRTLDAMQAALKTLSTDPLTRSGGTDDPHPR